MDPLADKEKLWEGWNPLWGAGEYTDGCGRPTEYVLRGA